MPRKATKKQKTDDRRQPAQTVEAPAVRPWLRFWRWPIAAGMLLVLSLFLFVLQSVRVFDIVDDPLRNLLIAHAGKRVKKTFDSRDISIILVDQNEQKDLPSGKSDISHRRYHADLVRALAGKARVVVFDMEFKTPSRDAQVDIDFAQAIKQAEESSPRTRVLVGANVDESGKEPAISPPLKAVLQDHWGIWDGGKISGTASVALVRLGLPSPNQTQPRKGSDEQLLIQSLALKAVEQFLYPDEKVQAFFDPIPQVVNLRRDGPQGSIVRSIPTNFECYMQVDLVGKDELVGNLYHKVYNLADMSEFENKIVVVGYQAEDDKPVLGSEKRYGSQIHANAISNILQDTFIRELGSGYAYLILVLMIAAGAVLRLKLSKLASYKLPVKLPGGFIDRSVEIPTMLLVVAFLYILVAIVFYLQRTVVALTYPLAALILSYLAIGAVRGRLGFK